MKLKFYMLGLYAALLPCAGSFASTYNDRETLITEFVQDMGSLEDSRVGSPAHDSADALLNEALSRLDGLSARDLKSLDSVIGAFSAHRKLAGQLAASVEGAAEAGNESATPTSLNDETPRLQVKLDNLTQNYLHVAQLVLFDTLADPERRLAISTRTKQQILAFVARYPVDRQDADGYLSALWFIREGLNKWKCADEV